MNYVSSVTDILEDVLESGRLSDVILITSDSTKIPAHKLILSSFSPIFHDIFLENSYDIPIVYLRGMSQITLQLILQFIYQGQCEIPCEKLEDFLNVAMDLQIKGLNEAYLDTRLKQKNSKAKELTKELQDNVIESKSMGILIANVKKAEEIGIYKADGNYLEIEEYLHASHEEPVTQLMEVNDEHKVENVLTNSKPFESSEHKKKYICDDCGLKFNQKDGLNSHQRKKHNIVSDKFKCRLCNYRASCKQPLILHISSVHDKVRYSCDQCDYRATQKSALAPHKQTKHGGVKFSCEVCGAILASEPILKKHLEYKHGNRQHSCDDCSYIAGQQHHLNTHRKLKHSTLN